MRIQLYLLSDWTRSRTNIDTNIVGNNFMNVFNGVTSPRVFSYL